MKTAKSVILLLLCTCLALGLIIFRGRDFSSQDPGSSTPTGSLPAATAPAEPMRAYTDAAKKLLTTQTLSMTYSYSQSRIVGGETYSEDRTGTACYTGRNSAAMLSFCQKYGMIWPIGGCG